MRKSGATAGGWDTYITGPVETNFKRFRSKQEIRRYFEQIGETRLRWEDFDFNPFGSKGQHEILQRMRERAEIMSIEPPAQKKEESSENVEVKPDIIVGRGDDYLSEEFEESKPDLGLLLKCEIIHD